MARKKPAPKPTTEPKKIRVLAIELSIPGFPVVSAALETLEGERPTLDEVGINGHEVLHELLTKLKKGEWS